MARWRVDLEVMVTYRVAVDADTEEEAREEALAAHEDGISTEVDSSAAEIEEVVRL